MVMYGVCKPLASLQQLQLPFQVLTSVYHILNYGSGQNRLHFARFRLICTSILHFASPILVPFAMSPCIFPLTSLPLLFSIRFFWILHLTASSFFWMAVSLFLFELSLSPAVLGLFRHECLTTTSFLFSVFALLSLLSLRVQCHFSLFLSLHGIRSTSDFDILPWPPHLSHGAYGESLSVYVILSCVLLIMSCLEPSPLGISFRRAMLMGGSSYRRSAVTVQPSNSIIWTSPRSAKCPGQVLDEQNWPIIIN